MNLLSGYRPRTWQKKALGCWVKDFRGIAKVVTGGGKTIFSYLCMEQFLNRYPDGHVIIVVPTIALLDQWYIDIIDATTIEDEDIATYSGAGHADFPKQINLMVLNTARFVAPKISEDSGKPSFLVIDECHRAGSVENARVLEGSYDATLGLSATPEREIDDGFEQQIIPGLGPIIYSYDYLQARKDGVIVDFDLINVEIDGTSESLREAAIATQEELISHVSGMSESNRLQEVIAKKAERLATKALRVPWAVKLTLSHKGQRIIIFHERVSSLSLIVKVLANHDQNSVAYHSHLSESHRRDNLRLFRRGAVNVLATCRALDEGANVPEANIAIVARSTSSTRQRIQRLGRVLRPAHGKKRATVYTLYSGDEEREKLAKEADGLEGVASIIWKKGQIA